jgi:hypothetical protein
MRDIAAPAEYFDTLREYDASLYGHIREQYPNDPAYTVMMTSWASNHLERQYGDDDVYFDTTVYSAVHLPPLFYVGVTKRTMMLAMYCGLQGSEQGLARIYELNLTPGREKLYAYPAYVKIGKSLLNLEQKKTVRPAKRAARRLRAFAPNDNDLEIIEEQLRIGATGAY